MATNQWIFSGDVQTRKTIFEPAYSTTLGRGATCKFFLGNTTTPLVVYSDAEASQSLGSEIQVDANARWPSVFVPAGNSYDYTINDFDGTLITQAVNVPSPQPGTGGSTPGGAYATGDVIWRASDGVRTGFVRLNGRTIGSGASSATERANDDTQDLYEELWNSAPDSTAPVIGGRGASATADFLANKPLTLFDARSASLAGLDTMGNTAGNFLADTPFTTGTATTVGSLAGYNAATVAIANLESHTHGVGTLITEQDGNHTHGASSYIVGGPSDGTHVHGVTESNHQHNIIDYRTTVSVDRNLDGTPQSVVAADGPPGNTFQSESAATNLSVNSNNSGHGHTITGNSGAPTPATHAHTISGATEAQGGGGNYNVVQRSVLGTFYIKL